MHALLGCDGILSGPTGDTAQSMWHALAEGLGVLLRLEVLAEQNSHIPVAFAMYRRSAEHRPQFTQLMRP